MVLIKGDNNNHEGHEDHKKVYNASTHSFVPLRALRGSLFILLLISCGSSEPPPEFREAFKALDKALATERLESSAFASRFPNPTAQQVVSFLLSQAGAEVLQISGSPLAEDIDVLSDVPVWPSGITLWHTSRQAYGRERQVILTWKDAEGIIVGTAIIGENADPVYVREWTVVPLSSRNPADPTDMREFQAF